jgi:hypothetical protein
VLPSVRVFRLKFTVILHRLPPVRAACVIIFGEGYKLWSSSVCSFFLLHVTSALLGPRTLSTLFSNFMQRRAKIKFYVLIFELLDVIRELGDQMVLISSWMIFPILVTFSKTLVRKRPFSLKINGSSYWTEMELYMSYDSTTNTHIFPLANFPLRYLAPLFRVVIDLWIEWLPSNGTAFEIYPFCTTKPVTIT